MTYFTSRVRIECRGTDIGKPTRMSASLQAALSPDLHQALLDLPYDTELRPRVLLRVDDLLLSAGGPRPGGRSSAIDRLSP